MENMFLCHRHIMGGAEYAVVEHFPTRGTNEIWNRGGNAVEVLRMFAQEQRQALLVWTEDMSAQVKEFLAEKFPGQDMSRVADAFVLKCITESVARKQAITHSHGHEHGGGIHI